jgi:ATP adenylyltransferase
VDAEARSTPPHLPTEHAERLWAPWRMRYVGGGAREEGCVFCNRLAEENDTRSLILWRAAHSFAIMNLFPYNTGHVMLVPHAHVPGPEEAEPATLAEMATLRRPLLRALRRALACDGFNLGINVGSFAGAGVAGHLHEHVVPRWAGDANFMPILAGTMVLPELIPVTYAKLRAEIERELAAAESLALVVLDPAGDRILVGPDGLLPTVEPPDGEAWWKCAVRASGELAGGEATLLGWGGEERAGQGRPTLALQAAFRSSARAAAPGDLPAEEARAVARVRSLLSGGHGG